MRDIGQVGCVLDRHAALEEKGVMSKIFDKEQTQAIHAGGGLVRVMAGAGTGKTTVLSGRIERLVREGTPPGRILATTFTNKAAGEMRERLVAAMPGVGEALRVHTIDSVAFRMCWRYPVQAGLREGFMLSDDDENASLLEEAAEQADLIGPGLNPKEREDVLKELRSRIDSWKANGLAVADGEPGPWMNAWLGYDAAMRSRNLVCFADLVICAARALADPEVVGVESGRVEHLLVDEFQDTNAAQLYFLRRLSSVHNNVFVVGDPDQSIYSFRKAFPAIMERASELLPEAARVGFTSVSLTQNRRCTDEVLVPACLVVGYNRRDEPKQLSSGRSGSEPIVDAHATCVLEAETVAREIHALRGDGADWSDIAVLGRTGRALEACAERFPAMGIPFIVKGGLRFSERTEVRDVMAWLKLAIDPRHDLALMRVASRPARGLGSGGAAAAVRLSRSTGITLHAALERTGMDAKSKPAARAAKDTSAMLGTLLALGQSGRPPADILDFVLGDIGYSDWAHAQKDAPKSLRSSLQALVKMAEHHVSLSEMIADSMLDPDSGDEASDSVSLGTIHASKGLEWSHVFLIAAEDGVLPSKRAIEERGNPDDPWDWRGGGGIEEERRLMHVAMTRAKDSLRISWAQSRRGMQGRASRMLHEAEMKVTQPRATISGYTGPAKGGKAVKKKPAFW